MYLQRKTIHLHIIKFLIIFRYNNLRSLCQNFIQLTFVEINLKIIIIVLL